VTSHGADLSGSSRLSKSIGIWVQKPVSLDQVHDDGGLVADEQIGSEFVSAAAVVLQ
jgi:phosphatidylglycerophosphatase A